MRRLVAAVVLTASFLACLLLGAPTVAHALTIDEAREQLTSIGEELSAINEKLNTASGDLSSTEQQIADTQEQIGTSESELASRRQELSKFVHDEYAGGTSSILDIVLGASSFDDVVSGLYYSDSVTQHKAELINGVVDEENALLAKQSDLENQKTEQENNMASISTLAVDAQARKDEATAVLTQLDAESRATLVQEASAASEDSSYAGVVNSVASVLPDDETSGSTSGGSTSGGTTGGSSVEAPSSSSWASDESYISQTRAKADAYGSDTDWFCCVDTDLARSTFFHKENGEWKFVAGWSCLVGKNYDGFSDCSWSGPRSRSFKGVWKVFYKCHDATSTWTTAYVGDTAYLDSTGHPDAQQFEVGGEDLDDVSLADRFQTHGCAGQNYDRAEWIYNNIPYDTTVCVFDSVNPWPSWYQWDTSPT